MARPLPAPLLPLLFTLTALPLCAQQHKVAAPEKVVRAIGVYEWTGDLAKPTASRFIPVSLFINGQMEDAGVYMTRPVPFAILTGNLYSLDQAGISKGMFDVVSAGRFGDTANFDDPWYAGGRFVPAPALKPPPMLRASKTLSPITATGIKNPAPDSSRPTLINRSPDARTAGNDSAHPTSDPANTAKTSPVPDATTTTKPSTTSSDDDADRPTLRRRSSDEQKEAQNQAPVANGKKSKTPAASVSGPATSLNDDPDRPTLHRGAAKSDDEAKILTGFPPGLQQMVGVSDPTDRAPHDFARPWDDDNEKAAITAKLESMARKQLAAYEKANPLPAGADTTTVTHAPTTITSSTPTGVIAPDTGAPKLQRGIPQTQTAAAPAATTPAPAPAAKPAAKAPTRPLTPAQRRKAAAAAKLAANTPPPPEPFLDEHIHGYLLSYGANPLFVFTAHTAGTGAALRYVTLVAEEDPYSDNELHLPIHSVTDSLHLDRTPDLRLIDAVDPDASNRADLLFELRYQNSRQFGLYRVLTGRSTQAFLSGTTR